MSDELYVELLNDFQTQDYLVLLVIPSDGEKLPKVGCRLELHYRPVDYARVVTKIVLY